MRSLKDITVCLLTGIWLVVPAQVRGGLPQQAQGERYYEQGKTAYEAGDMKAAAELFLQSAQLGYPAGEMQIGWHYEFGYGVPRDYEQARYWYTRSADQGYPAAIGALGGLYFFGKGVSVDYARALSFYTKAGLAGHANSQFQLGYMYEHGLGTQQDLNKALEWYQKAARDPKQTQAPRAVRDMIQALAATAYRAAQQIGLAVFPGAVPVSPYGVRSTSVLGHTKVVFSDAYFVTASTIDEVTRFYRSKYPSFELERDPKDLPKGSLALEKMETGTEATDLRTDDYIKDYVIILNSAAGKTKIDLRLVQTRIGPGVR